MTLIICYLFFGGKGGIKGFYGFTWFDWYLLTYLPDSFWIKAGTLLRSAPKRFFYSGLLMPKEGV